MYNFTIYVLQSVNIILLQTGRMKEHMVCSFISSHQKPVAFHSGSPPEVVEVRAPWCARLPHLSEMCAPCTTVLCCQSLCHSCL